jgi:hypothetical protein
MTPNQRDKAVAELTWLWVDYPGACAPPSILEKMVYGLAANRAVDGSATSDAMTRLHADALDIRYALASIPARQQSILHLALHPSCGARGLAVDRVRSTYYRQGGKGYTRAERLAKAEDAITLALASYAASRGIK